MRWLHPAAALIALGACKFEASCGDKVVKDEQVEDKLKADLGATKAECPDGVEAKVGATFECTAEIDGKTYAFGITVTDVKDDGILYNRESKTPIVFADKMSDVMTQDLTALFGAPATIRCPSRVMEVGADNTVTCDLTAGDIQTRMTVEVDADQKIVGRRFADNLLDAAKLVEILTPSVQKQTSPDVRVDCGPAKIIKRPPDGVVWCGISDGQKSAKIRVTTDEANNVKGWEVAEP